MLLFKELLERLFHAQKWLPPSVDQYVGKTFGLKFGGHAIQAAKEDRYGEIDLNKVGRSVTIVKNQVIEVETDDLTGQIRKFVVRKPYDDKRDVIIVFTTDGYVKTVWFNLKSDLHRSLNLRRYADKPMKESINDKVNDKSVEIMAKIKDGTATEQDWKDLEKMNKIAKSLATKPHKPYKPRVKYHKGE